VSGAAAGWLADGRRLHLSHGPIDLIIEAWGPTATVAAAHAAAVACFRPLLARLVEELPLLRRPVAPPPPVARGPVARRMVAAAARHAGVFVTPMAAVAGAVADHVLAAMAEVPGLARAYVNNGGDIALWLTEGQCFKAGTVARVAAPPAAPTIDAVATIAFASPVRGIATSGRGGRSFSFGIADAVTVLAADAAAADVAATLIANAVTCRSPAIRRAPAASLDPDSDLGDRPVVVAVGPLTAAEIEAALAAGIAVAERMRRARLIEAALLVLAGRRAVVGAPALGLMAA
jgi:ApbE superfamily uncharacterized protein (UPF0280 family)